MNSNPSLTEQNNSHGAHGHGLFCWKSIFTGILVTLLCYFILTSLGAGIGGFRIAHIIDRNESGSGIFTGAGVWLGLSAVISLFLGSYFATRLSTSLNRKIGGAQGVVIAAIFFAFLMHGASNTLGSLSQITGNYFNADSVSPNGTLVVVSDSDAERAARAVADIGWVLFATFLLGTASAVVGGYEGVLANNKRLMTVTVPKN